MKTRKRLLSLALALCMVLTMLPGVAWAADTPTSGTCGADGDNITWTLQSDGTLLLQGSGKTEDYGGAWFRLPAPWRDLADQIYEIRVEGSITYLGSCLFEDCTSAIGITLPGTLETIRSDSLPKGESASVEYVVVSPGQGNFVEDGGVLYAKECSMTDNYVIGNLEDGKETYYTLVYYPPARRNTSYTLLGKTEAIFADAFSGNPYLCSVELNDGLYLLGPSAFASCTALENVDLPYGITEVSDTLFRDCVSLSEVTIPSSVTTLHMSAFFCCDSLESIVLPASVTTIVCETGAKTDGASNYNLHKDFYFRGNAPSIRGTYNLGSVAVSSDGTEQIAITTNIYYPQGASGWDEFIQSREWSNVNFYPYTWEDDDTQTLEFSCLKSPVTIMEGNTARAKTTLSPSNATVTWSTSNPSVATVDRGGLVTAVQEGTATITGVATYGTQEKRVSYIVRVTSGIKISLLDPQINLKAGESAQLNYLYQPVSGTVSFTSSNPAVAAVSNGVVTGVGAGTATITATVTSNGVTRSATCQVTVENSNEQLAQALAEFAKNQEGKYYSDFSGLGFTKGLWCAEFVSWCAASVGAQGAIPFNSSSLELFKGVIDEGGTGVCFHLEDQREQLSGATVMQRGDYIPKVGDIVLIRWAGRDALVNHSGIVVEVNTENETISIVDGNTGNHNVKYRKNISYTEEQVSQLADGTIVAYATPNWSAATGTGSSGSVSITQECPIEVNVQFDGEVLDSATEQLSASFGFMTLNADESITVTLYDYYDVLTTITGTGTGTMTATVEFEDEDGTTATRTFSQVPIAEDTLITFRGFNLNSGTMLVLYKDYGDTFVEVWYADGNQTVQSADAGITEEFLAEMTFSGDEEETPTRRPTSTVTTQTATTHRVTAPEIANGSILVNPARPEAGDKVTLTVTPDTGYQLDTLTVTDGSGKTVQLTEQKDGTYTFIMPDGDVTVDAAFKLITGTLVQGTIATPFTDISGSRFKDAIAYCYANGIMNGVSATAFDPEGTLTRAMVVTTLYRVAGEPAVSGTNVFTDVADGQWYTDAVRWAAQNGVVEGYGDGRFGPNDPVTREQLAAILYRYANACGYYTGSTYPLDGFSDSAAVSAYAVEALEWAVANGTIVSRTVGVLDAGQSATRAEVAQALMVFCQSVVK